MTNNATKSANRGKKRKKPAAATSAAAAADDEESSTSAAAIIMDAQAMRVPGLSADLQQQITKFDSSEFDVSLDDQWGLKISSGYDVKLREKQSIY